MSVVPVVDISPFLSGSDADKSRVAHRIDEVCREIGFFCVVGHGVADEKFDAIYRTSKAFFHQSQAEKRRVRQPSPDQIRGYIGFGAAALATTLGEETPPDWKETFSAGPVDVARGEGYLSDPLARQHFAPNRWPRSPRGFEVVWTDYYRAMSRLAADMMRLFARALDLPEQFFAAMIDRPIAILGAQYYPNQGSPAKPGQLRAGGHTDFGTMTILRPDDAPGGLEVKTKAGGWAPAKAPPGTFIVNLGDLMARWTNDRWVSTLHRVANPPPGARSHSERLSIGFFHEPNYDTLVECLPSCCSAERPAKYPPILAGEHLYNQFTSQAKNPQVAEHARRRG